MRVLTTITTILLMAAWVVAGVGPAAAQPLQVQFSLPAATAAAIAAPDAAPPGANDWNCRPSPRHPRPVVLVHGSLQNMTFDWHTLSPLLKNAGYCVYALNYGQEPQNDQIGFPGALKAGGTGPVERSAAQLKRFVDRVRAASGSAKVDIVGHSQGGMMPRYYLKYLGGASSVNHLIGLSPSNHGLTLLGVSNIPGGPELIRAGLGTAFRQQILGSQFLRRLNAGGETVPGVRYTVIQTRFDEIVTPYTSAYLSGPGVENITLQRVCGQNFTDHLGIVFDRLATSFVMRALDPTAPIAPCVFSSPANGA